MSGRKWRTNEPISAFFSGFTRLRASRWTCRDRKCCGNRCCIATKRRARSVGESVGGVAASMLISGRRAQLRRYAAQGLREVPCIERGVEHADFPGAGIEQQDRLRV